MREVKDEIQQSFGDYFYCGFTRLNMAIWPPNRSIVLAIAVVILILSWLMRVGAFE
mgnify:CR=1 FL=1